MRPTRALATALALTALLAGCVSAPGPVAPPSPSLSGSPTTPPTESPSTDPPPTTGPAPSPSPTGCASLPAPPANLLGQDLTTLPTTARVVALTFDAGANADGVPSILATLAAQGITATFFLTGAFVEDFPAQSRAIAAAGHRIGNHSVNHPYFTQLSDEQACREVLDAYTSIVAVTGEAPNPWFRFPYGDRNPHTIALLNSFGYVPIRWTVDSLGWQGTQGGTRSASFVSDRVYNARTPGEIVLFHVGSHADGSTLDADALPSIIARLRADGYSFVTLDAMLG